MRIMLCISLAAFLFAGCDEIKEEDNIPTSKVELITMLEDTEEEQKDEEQKNSSESKILLVGRGSEPGWSAEFYSDKVKLSLDHGEVLNEIAYDFSNVANDSIFILKLSNIASTMGKKEIKNFYVRIEKESCKEESTGNLKGRKITLTFNDKTYKGCAGS